jgi:hypothetical protein
MRGMIADEWAKVQEEFKNRTDETDRILGDSWSSKVSAWLTLQARKLWLDRNKALYEPENGNESRLDKETKTNVRDLYAAELQMSESDRWIFGTPLHTMLTRPIVYQAQWVARYKDLIFLCVQEYRDREISQMADLRTYYEAIPKGETTPIRTPLQAKTPKATKNLKSIKLLRFFESSISPGERSKRATRAEAAKDARKEQE